MKIEVGKEYLDRKHLDNNKTVLVLAIAGGGVLFRREKDILYYSTSLVEAATSWSPLTPEEPKRHELKDMWVGWFKDSDGVFRGNPRSSKARALASYAHTPIAVTPATQDYCAEGEGLNDE